MRLYLAFDIGPEALSIHSKFVAVCVSVAMLQICGAVWFALDGIEGKSVSFSKSTVEAIGGEGEKCSSLAMSGTLGVRVLGLSRNFDGNEGCFITQECLSAIQRVVSGVNCS